MKFIETFREGDSVRGIYFCKQASLATTKNGKQYENLILQDKTGVIDCKIWDPTSGGIEDHDKMDYVDIMGEVTSFNGSLQLNVKRLRRADEGEYEPKDYFPISERDIDEMYGELIGYINSIGNSYLQELLRRMFVEDEIFAKEFRAHSAAKSVHHGFIGGLLEHTITVTKLCDFFAHTYPVLNRDLLITAALCHDVGKIEELSNFPENDYTDDGQLLGHIVIGVENVGAIIRTIDGFPKKLASELKHCIVAHHGELEYGSPKKPAIVEAMALNFADNMDAKMETIREIFAGTPENSTDWLGYNRLLETNIRKTSK